VGQGGRRVAALGTALVFAIACGSGSYKFAGRRFDPARGCLDPISTLSSIDGTDPGATCAAVCLVRAADDGGIAIYVTSACPPYPRLFDSSGTAPDCARALDAFAQGVPCLPDAGMDASGLADAPADAARD
jgi:hypothetical protein